MLLDTWDLPRSGIKLVFPELAGRFFTTEPPGQRPLMALKRKDEDYESRKVEKARKGRSSEAPRRERGTASPQRTQRTGSQHGRHRDPRA